MSHSYEWGQRATSALRTSRQPGGTPEAGRRRGGSPSPVRGRAISSDPTEYRRSSPTDVSGRKAVPRLAKHAKAYTLGSSSRPSWGTANAGHHSERTLAMPDQLSHPDLDSPGFDHSNPSRGSWSVVQTRSQGRPSSLTSRRTVRGSGHVFFQQRRSLDVVDSSSLSFWRKKHVHLFTFANLSHDSSANAGAAIGRRLRYRARQRRQG
jgi:hypothetical protein